MTRTLVLALLAILTACGDGPPQQSAANQATAKAEANDVAAVRAPEPVPDTARVRLVTEAGTIDLELNGRRAPITTANFLAYVDRQRLDGTHFYRAARTRGAPERGFIQGGIHRDYRRMLNPIAHEPTSATGLRHVSGTVSMARTAPGTAMGDFFIIVGDMPSMNADARGEDDDERAGYAAFGRVVGGMDVVRRILASPTVPNAGRGAMRGQMITQQVRIISARRLP